MACFTFRARFRMGADLNTTSIWEEAPKGQAEGRNERLHLYLLLARFGIMGRMANCSWFPQTEGSPGTWTDFHC